MTLKVWGKFETTDRPTDRLMPQLYPMVSYVVV